VALLRQARRALAADDPSAALVALDRHREIPAAQMAREAALLRAEALCVAGRGADGLRLLAQVESRWPGRPGAGAVRALCGE
jgi:hypothetical protein